MGGWESVTIEPPTNQIQIRFIHGRIFIAHIYLPDEGPANDNYKTYINSDVDQKIIIASQFIRHTLPVRYPFQDGAYLT